MNFAYWLRAAVPTTLPLRPLYPRQPTFQPAVRFRIVFVCFSEMNGPMAGLSGESESDPKPKLAVSISYGLR